MTTRDVMELPESELDRWRRYWLIEPWGAYRDNIHAAMICVQVLRPWLGEKAKIDISDFMLKDAKELKRTRMQQLVSQFGAAANRTQPVARKAKRR